MKKKSARKASEAFRKNTEKIRTFLETKNLPPLSDEHISWVYDYAIIRLYRDFENLILHYLVAAINNGSEHLSQTTGVEFPKHLKKEVCRYIIVGDGYFNFRKRDDLIRTLRKYLPEDHYLVTIIKKNKYKEALEQLSALRNFAAHDSKPSKKRALEAIGQVKMGSSGAWLKRQNRFEAILGKLQALADEVSQDAPY